MYELSVERAFSAAHAITINGQREPVHGHNWRVRLVVQGERLDANGLLCDFHLLERELDHIVGEFHNHNLNEISPFNRINPTAEAVARHIADSIRAKLPGEVHLVRLSVTEAPGCKATWLPDESENR